MSSETSTAHSTLRASALTGIHVTALGVAIALSGNIAGWNYGLAIGGWGGMAVAALAMVVLFFCLTQALAELAAALPSAAGFDSYVGLACGELLGYVAGMSVAIALAIGAGLAIAFSEAYVSASWGIGGWPFRIGLVAALLWLQLRGVREAAGLTVLVGTAAVLMLVCFCVFISPEFRLANLYSSVAGQASLFPNGVRGAVQCVPFALFLFLGVEQAAHAASEVCDMQKTLPKALMAAVVITFVVGMGVLLIATGAIGTQALAVADDPLLTVVSAFPERVGVAAMRKIVAAGALVAMLGTLFSLALTGSRQFFHLARAGWLPARLQRVNRRQAPATSIYLVAMIALSSSAFAPGSTMVVFIFLISVSYVLLLTSFVALRLKRPDMTRPYRAIGGCGGAAIAIFLSLAVLASCYQLQVHALQVALAMLLVLALHFIAYRPARAGLLPR